MPEPLAELSMCVELERTARATPANVAERLERPPGAERELLP
jgi:hypothetical protein